MIYDIRNHIQEMLFLGYKRDFIAHNGVDFWAIKAEEQNVGL